MEDKNFGFRGTVTPSYLVKDVEESWSEEGIYFTIKEGIFTVSYDNKEDELKARKLADIYLKAASFKKGIPITAEFNNSWSVTKRGKDFSLNLEDRVATTERLIVKTMRYNTKGKARIVSGYYDSALFNNNKEFVIKCLKDDSLYEAITFFDEEVLDSKKPLVGAYKALEILEKAMSQKDDNLSNKEKLGRLVGKGESYIDKLKQSMQGQRHARTHAKQILNEQDCRNGVRELIEAYSNEISL